MTNNKNITNQRFATLVALRPTEQRFRGSVIWECLCDCGKTVHLSVCRLPQAKSCGDPVHIPNKLDLRGRRFGKLTALEPSEQREKRCVKWKCRCDCGALVYIKGSKIKNGHNTSCGCRIGQTHKPHRTQFSPEDRAIKLMINDYRRGAINRELAWELTPVNVKSLIFGHCSYCGRKPSRKLRTSKHVTILVNGIDRVDSSKGYRFLNCVSCCAHCNRAKGSMGRQEFRDWVQRVHAYLFVPMPPILHIPTILPLNAALT